VRNLLAAAPSELRPRSAHVRDLSLIELIGLLRYTQGARHVHATNLQGPSTGIEREVRVPVETLSMAAVRNLDLDLDLDLLDVFDGVERLELTGFGSIAGSSSSLLTVRHAKLAARRIDLACLPQALQSLAIDWPEVDFTQAPRVAGLTDLQIGPYSALTSLDGIERFSGLRRLDLAHCPEVTRLDLTPLERCASLEALVLPAWTDLSAVNVPAGLDVAVVSDGELFGFALELQDPALGLVPDRWGAETQGLSDDELELRGWNDYVWPGLLDDDLTAQDWRQEAHESGEPLPAVPGDDDTIGWSITGPHTQRAGWHQVAQPVGLPKADDDLLWPDRRAILRLVNALTERAEELALLDEDALGLESLLGLIQQLVACLNSPPSEIPLAVADLTPSVKEMDPGTWSDVTEIAATIDVRWHAKLLSRTES
jgi:hypothetical protein